MDKEDLGYLKATVDQNSKQIETLLKMFEEHIRHDELKTDVIMKQIDAIRDELDMYKLVARILKLVGASVVLILTLKFGDIGSLWRGS